MELASSFMRSRAFLTACELNLFAAIGLSGRTAAEVAQTLGTDPRATDRLLRVLTTLGLVDADRDRFRNGAAAERFLVPGRPEHMGGLLHWVHLWDSWSTLTSAVRKGGSLRQAAVGARGAEWLEAFIAAMHWRARQHAPEVVGALDLAGVSRVLDVGGGSGAYAMAFARAVPGLRATVFDLPAVLPITARYVGEAGLADRIDLVAGDYDRDPVGRDFDLVLLSAIIHSNAPAANQALVAQCAAALAPEGRLVIQDFIVDENRTGPPFAVLFALNMLVGTEAGDTYTESDVRGWMTAAGLGDLTRRDMPFGTSLIFGRKPAGAA
jgi:SAM-dependent methyltransferase